MDSSIESAMVAFGKTLTAMKSGKGSTPLQQRAQIVKTGFFAVLRSIPEMSQSLNSELLNNSSPQLMGPGS